MLVIGIFETFNMIILPRMLRRVKPRDHRRAIGMFVTQPIPIV